MNLETLKRAASNLQIDIRSLQRQLGELTLSDDEAEYLGYALEEANSEFLEIRHEIAELEVMTPEELEDLQ